MASDLIILGANDEQTECDRCGRVELRGTVILGTADREEVGRYGSVCAGYMLNPSATRARGVITLARKVEAVRRDRIYWALKAAHRALAENVKWEGDTAPGHLRACKIVTDLEKAEILHRADEVAAVAAVRAKAREIRRAA